MALCTRALMAWVLPPHPRGPGTSRAQRDTPRALACAAKNQVGLLMLCRQRTPSLVAAPSTPGLPGGGGPAEAAAVLSRPPPGGSAEGPGRRQSRGGWTLPLWGQASRRAGSAEGAPRDAAARAPVSAELPAGHGERRPAQSARTKPAHTNSDCGRIINTSSSYCSARDTSLPSLGPVPPSAES